MGQIEEKYDDEGNVIYRKIGSIEMFPEFNQYGSIINRKYRVEGKDIEVDVQREHINGEEILHITDSTGSETIKKYNKQGRLYYYKNSNGDEWKENL